MSGALETGLRCDDFQWLPDRPVVKGSCPGEKNRGKHFLRGTRKNLTTSWLQHKKLPDYKIVRVQGPEGLFVRVFSF